MDSEDEDTSQPAQSQNTLVESEAASPLTQVGLPSAEERKEDEITANMHQAKVLPRGGNFAAIEQRLEQESQERRNAAQVTPSIL